MPDFWRNSGFHLLARDRAGRLAPTDDFLRAYLLRPEIRPIEESGPGERALHAALLDAPDRAVSERELEAIEDPDTRFNYRVLLDFLARLRRAGSVEACYAGIFAEESVRVPPLFLDQLAQIVLRNVLDGVDDPLEARAGELFFREQKASVEGGAIMLADLETVEMHASGSAYGALGRLIVEAQAPLKSATLEVLDEGNAVLYWERDQRHDLVLAINYGRAGLAALARVLERWVRHLVGVEVSVTPLRQVEDARWSWHVGLDAQSTAILNDLWRGVEVDSGRMRQLLALFRLEFADAALMRRDLAGKPVYLALAMDEANVVRMKPQNLLTNLPLAAHS
ncbi:MAG: hypothetical protein KJ025_05995 [Burkholderiales bacterium]|nr:hypothetical protein [Burkholderiales bacterium]